MSRGRLSLCPADSCRTLTKPLHCPATAAGAHLGREDIATSITPSSLARVAAVRDGRRADSAAWWRGQHPPGTIGLGEFAGRPRPQPPVPPEQTERAGRYARPAYRGAGG